MAANPEELQSLVRGIAKEVINQQQRQVSFPNYIKPTASRSSSRAPSPVPSAPPYVEYTAPSKASKISPKLQRRDLNKPTAFSTPDLTQATRYSRTEPQINTEAEKNTKPLIQKVHIIDPQILAQIAVLHKRIEYNSVQNIRLHRHTTKNISILSQQVLQLEKDFQQLEKQQYHRKRSSPCVIRTAVTIFGVLILGLTITTVYLIIKKID